jgi:catechol 2,3-dioxygenase-like lactoylglutathione lyase family enzyme
MTESRGGVGTLGQVGLSVQDLDAAVEFYGETLGLRLIGRFPPGLAFFDIGSTRLMITGVEEASKIRNSTLYFNVPDIHISYDELVSRGVVFEAEPKVIHATSVYQLSMAFFRDPEGNVMAIMDEHGTLTA